MSGAQAITIRGLKKRFGRARAEVTALDDVSLSAEAGSFVSLVGPSGCGKSTLLYIVGGFVPPSEGEVLVNGAPVRGPGLDRGVVFQEYALFPWLTVFDNIAYGLRRKGTARAEVRATVERYVELMHLQGFESRFPRELSGGMKQRVALARTFAYQPEILLLDEPFGALDSQTRELMQDELLRLWRSSRKTVLMVTHDINEAVYLSDTVYVMSRRPGRMVHRFTVDLDRNQAREELATSPEYTAIYHKVWIAVREQVRTLEPAA